MTPQTELKFNMNMTDNAELVGKHKFEIAGLGKAPFRFVGMTINQFNCGDGTTKPGGSCDYCSNGILYEFHIISVDGKKSKVGCNCINKVGDAGLMKAYKSSPEFRKYQRELRNAKGIANAIELRRTINFNAHKLALIPHPRKFTDRKTGRHLTMLDQMAWLANNCGNAGRAATLRLLHKILAGN